MTEKEKRSLKIRIGKRLSYDKSRVMEIVKEEIDKTETTRTHGEWKTEPYSRIIHCSNCDAIENLNRLYVSKFCYSCGSLMVKEGDEND